MSLENMLTFTRQLLKQETFRVTQFLAEFQAKKDKFQDKNGKILISRTPTPKAPKSCVTFDT